MSESDLKTYRLQLQQVELSLQAEPDNGELQKLKEDLEQVITLTEELLTTQLGQDNDAISTETSGSVQESSSKLAANLTPVKHWQVGEQCQALWGRDGLYYEAKINEITTDGEVSVTFKHNKQTEITSLGLLKLSKMGYTGSSTNANRKEQIQKQREYLKAKKAKKAERFKKLEKESERGKNQWKHFSNKAFGKKGFVKKSIFKTPETASGRVGVGTCGVSGQEMTKYTVGAKLKRGT